MVYIFQKFSIEDVWVFCILNYFNLCPFGAQCGKTHSLLRAQDLEPFDTDSIKQCAEAVRKVIVDSASAGKRRFKSVRTDDNLESIIAKMAVPIDSQDYTIHNLTGVKFLYPLKRFNTAACDTLVTDLIDPSRLVEQHSDRENSGLLALGLFQ